MSEHYDGRETRAPEERERDLLSGLPSVVDAALKAPGWRQYLGGVDPRAVASRAGLAALPVLRKSDLPALQAADPPFGGLNAVPLSGFARLFTSPGPIFEPEADRPDPWGSARALFAAGLRRGEVLLNTFGYHLTPGGFILDSGARALGCPVIPAGPGNTQAQLDLIAHYRPVAYTGTPDFLKILLDAAEAAGRPAASIGKALVSGAAFPPSLQAEFSRRGVQAYQAYATADLGVIAYETGAREGLVVNEDLILEIVRPGTAEPVPEGEVGEVVVTSLDPARPMIRLALGDLSALMPGPSPCGRTNARIRGWMGRADQTAKVRGMFVRPDQVAAIAARHPEATRLRLVVSRDGEQDGLRLLAEAEPSSALEAALGESVQAVLKLRARVEIVRPGTLPNDGQVIADERPVG